MYSTYFHEWVCETYTPCGIVYATEVAKTILNKNHLSPSEFIRPFGDFTGKKILVPFGEKSNNEIKNFRIDFYDNDKFIPIKSNCIFSFMTTLLFDEKVKPKWTIDQPIVSKRHFESLVSKIKYYSFPWGNKFEQTLFECLKFNECEMYQYPLVGVYICSLSERVDVIEEFKRIDKVPRLIKEGIFDRPKATLVLILNDKSDKENYIDNEEKVKKYEEFSTTYGTMIYYVMLVDINGKTEGDSNNNSEFWSRYFHMVDLYDPDVKRREQEDYGALISTEEMITLQDGLYNFFNSYAIKKISEHYQNLSSFIEQNKKGIIKKLFGSKDKTEIVNYYNIYKLTLLEKSMYIVGMYHFYFRNYQSASENFKYLYGVLKEKSTRHYLPLYELNTICTFINGTYKKEENIQNFFIRYSDNSTSYLTLRAFIIFLKIHEHLHNFTALILNTYNIFLKTCDKYQKKNRSNSGHHNNIIDIFTLFMPLLYEKNALYYLIHFNKFRKFLVQICQAGRKYYKCPPEMRIYALHSFGFFMDFFNTNQQSFISIKDALNAKMGNICNEIKYYEGGFMFYKNLIESGKYEKNKQSDEQAQYMKYYLSHMREISNTNLTTIKQSELYSLNTPDIDNASLLIFEDDDNVISSMIKNKQKSLYKFFPWSIFDKYKDIDGKQRYCHLDEKDVFLLKNLDNISFNTNTYSNINLKRSFKGNINNSIYVIFDIYNTLSIDFPISNLKLICDFIPINNTDNSLYDRNISKFLEFSSMSLTLQAKATERICLYVKPLCAGKCIIKGVEMTPYNCGLLKHFFNTKKKNKLYSYRKRRRTMSNERKGSTSSQSSQSSGNGFNMITPTHKRNFSISIANKKSDIIYDIIDKNDDIQVTFPHSHEIEIFKYQLYLMPIVIEVSKKIKMKRFTIFLNDSNHNNDSRRIVFNDYITKDNCFTEDIRKVTVYIPIYAVENIVDEYIKILIKFEEESKMKYVEIKRYLVKVKVMNSITFTHNENIEQYDFTEENEAKKTNVLFCVKSSFSLSNGERLKELSIDDVIMNSNFRINNKYKGEFECKKIEEDNEINRQKLYTEYHLETNQNNKNQNPNQYKALDSKYQFPFIPQDIRDDPFQSHISDSIAKILNRRNILFFPWKAIDTNNQCEVNGISLYDLKLNQGLTYKFLKDIIKNSSTIKVDMSKIDDKYTLVTLKYTLNKKSITEIKEIEWYEVIVKDTEEHNIKWLGNKVIRIMNYITDNKEENYLNFFFSFMTDYKGYYEINNISVLLHTKEPSSTIIEIKNVSNSIGISLN